MNSFGCSSFLPGMSQIQLHFYECAKLCNHLYLLVIYRELPELAKQFVMRTLFAEQPVPETLVAAWVKSDHQK